MHVQKIQATPRVFVRPHRSQTRATLRIFSFAVLHDDISCLRSAQRRNPCEHGLEAMRPIAGAKVPVMHGDVTVFFLCTLASGAASSNALEDPDRNVPRAVCALGTVHVLLRHAPLRVSCVPCGCMEDSDQGVEIIFWQLYVHPLLRPSQTSES